MLMVFKAQLALMALLAATPAPDVFDLGGLMQTSASSIQTQLFTVLNIVVPAIVSIMAVVICVKFGMDWLKKLGGVK